MLINLTTEEVMLCRYALAYLHADQKEKARQYATHTNQHALYAKTAQACKRLAEKLKGK